MEVQDSPLKRLYSIKHVAKDLLRGYPDVFYGLKSELVDILDFRRMECIPIKDIQTVQGNHPNQVVWRLPTLPEAQPIVLYALVQFLSEIDHDASLDAMGYYISTHELETLWEAFRYEEEFAGVTDEPVVGFTSFIYYVGEEFWEPPKRHPLLDEKSDFMMPDVMYGKVFNVRGHSLEGRDPTNLVHAEVRLEQAEDPVAAMAVLQSVFKDHPSISIRRAFYDRAAERGMLDDAEGAPISYETLRLEIEEGAMVKDQIAKLQNSTSE